MSTAYLVTGTTRGIGRALAKVILNNQDLLYSLSSAPDMQEGGWCNLQCDLSIPEQVIERGGSLVHKMGERHPDAMVLINNAATIDPIAPLDMLDSRQMLYHLQVNQAAPALLMSTFISRSTDFGSRRHIINISSGAAIHPYSGWAMYCAVKAALDMMTLCAALEQSTRSHPVWLSAVYPGKVDTQMQTTIRQADPVHFPLIENFIRAKQDGDLAAPMAVAQLLIELYRHGQFKNGCIYDLRSVRQKHGGYAIDPIRSIGESIL